MVAGCRAITKSEMLEGSQGPPRPVSPPHLQYIQSCSSRPRASGLLAHLRGVQQLPGRAYHEVLESPRQGGGWPISRKTRRSIEKLTRPAEERKGNTELAEESDHVSRGPSRPRGRLRRMEGLISHRKGKSTLAPSPRAYHPVPSSQIGLGTPQGSRTGEETGQFMAFATPTMRAWG